MEDLLERAFSTKLNRSKILWDSHPLPKFLPISLTGEKCALNCDHCRGRYLRDMISVGDAEDLYRTCVSLDSRDAWGVLLSGGYNEGGYVPFEPFLDAIARIKRDTELFVSVHSGPVPESLARDLGDAGVDSVYFNLIDDDETIKSKLGIDRTVGDYKRSLGLFAREIPHVAPHLLLGLSGEDLQPERKALEALSDTEICTLVFLILIPPSDFDSKEYAIPPPEDIAEFIAESRIRFPEIPLALGCMRPRGGERVDTEIGAIKAGIDRVELASKSALESASRMGLRVQKLEACCGVPESLIENRGDT